MHKKKILSLTPPPPQKKKKKLWHYLGFEEKQIQICGYTFFSDLFSKWQEEKQPLWHQQLEKNIGKHMYMYTKSNHPSLQLSVLIYFTLCTINGTTLCYKY